jgi:hypothetical protein
MKIAEFLAQAVGPALRRKEVGTPPGTSHRVRRLSFLYDGRPFTHRAEHALAANRKYLVSAANSALTLHR